MEISILDAPLRFRLFGRSSAVRKDCIGEVGRQLMDDMWGVVKAQGIATTGINHWVYLANGDMFVGVELVAPDDFAGPLDQLEFRLERYLKHLHFGPYDLLPAKWAALKAELASRGERVGSPSLEVYGHCPPNPALAETTIYIALAPQ